MMLRRPQPDVHAGDSGSGRRRGFTLVEMLVSLAVLTVALTVVGVVFAVTTKTASQAAAYSEVLNWVRQWEEQMREDLRYVDPARSVLVVLGRKQSASLTKADLQSKRWYREQVGNPVNLTYGYDPTRANQDDPFGVWSSPRADILMFITNRPAASQAPVPNPNAGTVLPAALAASLGAKFAPQIVVYGHAALADALWVPGSPNGSFTFPDEYTSAVHYIEKTVNGMTDRRSTIPAAEWHLARVAKFPISSTAAGVSFPQVTLQSNLAALDNEVARTQHCQASIRWPGELIAFDVDTFLAGFQPGQLPGGASAALLDPYARLNGWVQWDSVPVNWSTLGASFSLAQSLRSLIFPDASELYHMIGTVLRDTPVELRSNQGVQLLPGCAWFQVEILMPEDPRNSISYVEPIPTGIVPPPIPFSARADFQRWTEVPAVSGQTPLQPFVFVPDTPENRNVLQQQVTHASGWWSALTGFLPQRLLDSFARVDQDPSKEAVGAAPPTTPESLVGSRVVRTWPYAIRVTVHAFDPKGRLPADQPVVRSVVHRFE